MEMVSVDTEKVRSQVKKLEALREKSETQKSKKQPSQEKDCGNTHTELVTACTVVDESWENFINLLDKTIEYMKQLCNAYDESDKESAGKIKVALYDTVEDQRFDHYVNSHSEQIGYLHSRGINDNEIRQKYDVGGDSGIDTWITELKGYHDSSFDGGTYYVLNNTEQFLYCQHNYSCYTDANGGNSGCGMTSMAVCRSIVSGNVVEPTSLSTNSYCNWHEYGFINNRNISNRLTAAYDELKQGYPSIMNVQASSGGNHYVVVAGVREGANRDNLSWSDFNVVEVGTGQLFQADKNPYSSYVDGPGQLITMDHGQFSK